MFSRKYIRYLFLENNFTYAELLQYIQTNYMRTVKMEDIVEAIEDPFMRNQEKKLIAQKKIDMEIDKKQKEIKAAKNKIYSDILMLTSILIRDEDISYYELSIITKLEVSYLECLLHNDYLKVVLSLETYEWIVKKVEKMDRSYKKQYREAVQFHVKKSQKKDRLANKVFDLIPFILLEDKLLTYSQMAIMIDQKQSTIYDILHDEKSLKSTLDNWLYKEITKKVSQMDYEEEKKDKSLLYNIYDTILYEYTHSRKFLRDCGTGIVMNHLEECKFVLDNYGDDFIKEVKTIKKNLRGHNSYHSVDQCITEEKMIEIVKPSIIKVSPYVYKCLEVVAQFFENYGNVKKTCQVCEKYTYNALISLLKNPQLKDVLTEKSYRDLQVYLSTEKYFISPEKVAKDNLIQNTLLYFYQYNGNIDKIVEQNFVQIPAMFRVLTDPAVEKMIGKEEYDKIFSIIEHYNKKNYVIKVLQSVRA